MRLILKRLSCVIIGVAAGIGGMSSSLSQTAYPNKPIRMVLPFAPGGSSVNIVGRMVEQVLSAQLSVPVLIDNKSGAAGSIGAEYVAKAAPDGYTVLFSTASLISNSALYKNATVDPLRDFAPVTMVYTTPALYVISNSIPVSSVKDLVSYVKQNPGKLIYGSSGVGGSPHLAVEALFDALSISGVHVPYKGTSQAMPDLLSGRIHMFAAAPAAVISLIKDKSIKGLVLASKERLPELPEVPTTHEMVEPNFEVGYWSGMWAPVRTPAAIVNRLHSTLEKYFLSPEGRARLRAVGAIPVVSKPAEFGEFLMADLNRWTRVIQKAGIKAEAN